MDNLEAVVVTPWYTEDAFQRLGLALSAVGLKKELKSLGSYEEFVEDFNGVVAKHERKGVKVEKLVIDVEKMLDWCIGQRIAMDEDGRRKYMQAQRPDVVEWLSKKGLRQRLRQQAGYSRRNILACFKDGEDVRWNDYRPDDVTPPSAAEILDAEARRQAAAEVKKREADGDGEYNPFCP